ncbi:MAG: GtrA family protein [bacterium]|nr:GtrA family protein [bacterium]
MINRLTQNRIFRYLVSGGSATVIALVLLYTFTEWLGLWYIFSVILAFIITFLVSFTLQKFWVFEEGSRDRIVMQGGAFLTIALMNLGINTLGMFVLVSKLHVWYMLAEVLVLASIAIENYFLQRNLVFAKKIDNLL